MTDSTENKFAVVGVGGVFPGASSIREFWQNIVEKRVFIERLSDESLEREVFFRPEVRDQGDKQNRSYTDLLAPIKDLPFDPGRFRIPPKAAEQMDDNQKLALLAAEAAMATGGLTAVAKDRVAVFMGNTMIGQKHHDHKNLFDCDKYEHLLKTHRTFAALSDQARDEMLLEIRKRYVGDTPVVTEDTAPGVLPNIIAARVSAVFDLHGPAYVIDAACASGLAAIICGLQLLRLNEADAAICGAADRQNAEFGRIYFSGIGALSPDGSFPFDARANGFVVGDGAGAVIIKRLRDAILAEDDILAVITGYGQASDGKGKAIAAPNPIWQARTIAGAWQMAGISADTIELIEAHGTATRVGDASEVAALKRAFDVLNARRKQFCGIGSVKSNIGHLKSAAGIAGFLKAVMALKHGVLPPTAGVETENPDLALAGSPFYILKNAREWTASARHPRRAGVSAFGFGGADYHIAVEEYRETDYADLSLRHAVSMPSTIPPTDPVTGAASVFPSPVDHADAMPMDEPLFFSGNDDVEVIRKLEAFTADLQRVPAAAVERVLAENLFAKASDPVRLALVFTSVSALWRQLEQVKEYLPKINGAAALAANGIALGRGKPVSPEQVAVLFPGQGSQYGDMLAPLFARFTAPFQTLMRADAIWKGLSGFTVSELLDTGRLGANACEVRLRQTENTHPAMVTAGLAVYALLNEMGLRPGVFVGHSVGELTALKAAGRLSFADFLMLVHGRGAAFSEVPVDATGSMVALPISDIETEALLKETGVDLAVANRNGPKQTIVSGADLQVAKLVEACEARGIRAIRLNVSHAFHSPLMAPAEAAFSAVLARTAFSSGTIPVADNQTNTRYGASAEDVRRRLRTHITGAVQFGRTIETLYDEGVRVYVEAGPGRVLSRLVRSILEDRDDARILACDRRGASLKAFLEAVSGLFAAGVAIDPTRAGKQTASSATARPSAGSTVTAPVATEPRRTKLVYSGVAVGLPGAFKESFRDDNFEQLFEGRNFIERLSDDERGRMVDLGISKVIKSAEGASFKSLSALSEVIQLAGKMGILDMKESYAIDEKDAEDMSGAIAAAVAAGYEALKDAHIPLVHEYSKTGGGSMLPERWSLPREMQAETGVIFANGFPMVEPIIAEVSRHLSHRLGHRAKEALFELYDSLIDAVTDRDIRQSLLDWYAVHRAALADAAPDEGTVYQFNHRLMTQIAMQANNRLAKYINARGPNFQINAACSSTTTAVTLAESLIANGKAARMIVIGGDDPTSEHTLPYLGAAFLSTGACTHAGDLFEAAIPFDKRRSGMIMGAGGVGIVIETDEACRRRGIEPVAELLGTHCFNAAGHGSQLDIPRYATELDRFMSAMEARHGLNRLEMADKLVYLSHETYTPPRGGCAEAEAVALQHVFGDAFRAIEVGNTKGMTGHTMGAAIEDAAAAKALQLGKAPPVVNHRVPDPALEGLNLSRGARKDFEYALRMAAGFGSQGNYVLLKRRAVGDARVSAPERYEAWLREIAGNERPVLVQQGRVLAVADDRPGAVTVDRPSILAEYRNRKSSMPYFVPAGETVIPPPSVSELPGPPAELDLERRVDPGVNVHDLVLEVVSDITGYEVQVLDEAMDLDADLGIDTVKQAMVLATLGDCLGLKNLKTLKLSEYPTIGHLVALFEGSNLPTQMPPMNPDLMPAPTPDARPDTVTGARRRDGQILAKVMAVVSEVTGYAPEILDKEMELEADLGVDTVKQATIWVMLADAFGVDPENNINLSDFTTISSLSMYFEDVPERAAAKEEPEDARHVSPVSPLVKSAPSSDAPRGPSRAEVMKTLLQVLGDETPYPAEMLTDDTRLAGDLGLEPEEIDAIGAALTASFHLGTPLDLSDDPNLGALCDTIWRTIAGGDDDVWIGRSVSQLMAAPLREGESATLKDEQIWVVGDDPETIARLSAHLAARGGRTHTIALANGQNDITTALKAALETAPPTLMIDLTMSPRAPLLAEIAPEATRTYILHAMESRFMLAKTLTAAGRPPRRVLAVTAIDGRFALAPSGETSVSPLFGLHLGVYRSIRKVWQRSTVSVLDLAPSAWQDDGGQALALIEAELTGAGDGVEICYPDGQRHRVAAAASSLDDLPSTADFGQDEVVVATGGASGVTAEIVCALARRRPAAFALIGRTPLNPDARRLVGADESMLTRERTSIFRRLEKDSERVTPAQVERILSGRLRSAAVFETLEALERLGAKAEYFEADVRDAKTLASVLVEVRQRFGPITTVIHGAGIEVSRRLAEKSVEELRQVHTVKTIGAIELLRLTQGDPLRRVVWLSSIAGRFGSEAQVDYAGANAFLDLLARSERRPGVRAVSLVFSGFGEKGMAWRNTFVRTHAEKSGLNLIPPRAGAECAVAEMVAPNGPREVILHRGLGSFIDPAAADVDLSPYPLIDWVERLSTASPAVIRMSTHRRFSIERDALLDQHRLAGTPLMPGVGFMEMMAETAVLLGAPREGPFVFRNLAFTEAFKLHRELPRDVRVDVAKTAGDEMTLIVRSRFVPKEGLRSVCRDYAKSTLVVPAASTPPMIAPPNLKDARQTTWAEVLDDASDMRQNVWFGPLFNEARQPKATRRSSQIRLSDGGIETVVTLPEAEKTHPGYPLEQWLLNPAFLDTLHQAGAVLTIELTGHVYLPVGADTFAVWCAPNRDALYRVHAALRYLDADEARFDMAMLREGGTICATIEGARFKRIHA